MNGIPDSFPDRLVFLDGLAIPLALRMPFYSPLEGLLRTRGKGGIKMLVNAVTGSLAKLPIGEPFDVKVNGRVASIGLFQRMRDANHIPARRTEFHPETRYFY